MHYVIIIIFVVVIIFLQLSIYRKTTKKIARFSEIFPDTAYKEWELIRTPQNVVSIVGKEDVDRAADERNAKVDAINEKIAASKAKMKMLRDQRAQFENDGDDIQTSVIDGEIKREKTRLQELKDSLASKNSFVADIPDYKSDNGVRDTIVSSINKYLERNISSTSDFHLIKDIVDRNSDAADNEIQTQIPVPLYCGLMGTMLGIIVGILYLWLSGDLDALLGVSQNTDLGASGIKALLGGVALAMISSIFGIALTTSGAWKAKKAKSHEESAKHNFLSWMQVELLPAMNTDAASAMHSMVENLTNFNSVFASNITELNDSLSHVSDATKGQADILEAINNLKINRIAAANIEVYDKLRNCTREIGQLGQYLDNAQEYIANVRALNEKLDDADARSRMVEEMALYFKQERANIEHISGVISYSMGQADSALQKSISILKENITKQNDSLVQFMVEQNERMKRVLDEQQVTLQSKALALDQITKELEQLPDVKQSMQSLNKAISEQNHKLENLKNAIFDLAKAKVNEEKSVSAKIQMPTAYKVLIIIASTIVSLAGLYFLSLSVLSIFGVSL